MPLTLAEFMEYLKKQGMPDPWPSAIRIRRLVHKMCDTGILANFGQTSQLPMFGEGFVTSGDDSTRAQNDGYLWLSTTIGAPMLIPAYGSITVQITGSDANGDVRSGTGLTLDPWHVLTNAHVTQDMRLDQDVFSSRESPPMPRSPGCANRVSIKDVRAHDAVDVAVIELNKDTGNTGLPTLDGLAFRAPAWAVSTVWSQEMLDGLSSGDA